MKPKDEKNRKPWEPMEITHVGNVHEVVQMPGTGKTGAAADPGDLLKPPGQVDL